jgi:UDP-glucose 4-epimerase
MNILLTGGMGYIGSHAAASLIEKNHKIFIFDNLKNSDKQILKVLKKITNENITFVKGDINNLPLLKKTLRLHRIDSVIHFAGLKSVAESVINPILYFRNNVQGTITLLQAMEETETYQLVFSGSATVYGDPQYLPINESHQLNAMNPYGKTKQHIEEILRAAALSNPLWSIVTLRYFNPIGAHPSGLLGENISGLPNNIMPLICKVALNDLKELNVYGNDYNTKDGSGIRDYIHIMDLIEGHIAALSFINSQDKKPINKHDLDLKNYHSFNLGTGKGFSVLELINAFQEVSGISIPYEFKDRRSGDIAECYADIKKANKILKWSAKRTLNEMCQSCWEFIN